MKKILVLAVCLSFMSCTKNNDDEETVQVNELDVALVTEGVNSVSTASRFEPASIDLGGSCSGCAQSAQLMTQFTKGALTLMGIPDAMTCLVEALTETQVIAGLGDGQTYYIEDSEDNELTRLRVTVTGSEITSYTAENCVNGTQESHVSYTLSGGSASFTIKGQSSDSRPMRITATGNYTDGAWTSKSVDIEEDGASEDGHYAFTQYADYVSVALTTDSIQFYGEAALAGSNVSDYAMGAGSVKSNVLSTVHFDENGADTSTASSYSSSVNSASFAAAASLSSVSPSGDEVFSCSIPTGSSATPFTGSSATITEFQRRFAACQALIVDTE